MSQLALDLPKHNGNGRHGRRERDLAAEQESLQTVLEQWGVP